MTSRGQLSILTPICLDPALRRLGPQLQAHLAVQPVDPLRIHPPPFATQQHMDTTIAVAHPGGGDLPDTFGQMSLSGSSGSGRSIGRPATHGKHVECLLAKSHDPPGAASGQALKLSADQPIVVGGLADPGLGQVPVRVAQHPPV